ncbi:MAG TPA: hypothetical protein PKN64_10550 [Casimicrobium sp.]|nr:hypothetical protein [Casimicrobium sp.]
MITKNRLVGFGLDAVGIPYDDLPELIVELAGQSAQSMARETLNIETMSVPSGFPHLETLLSEPARGALALFPIAFGYHYLYASKCLELGPTQQQDLYQKSEIAISKLISANDVIALLRVCREVFRLIACAVGETKASERSATHHRVIRFGFSNEAVRLCFQAALGRDEADRLENDVGASYIVTGLNVAAANVGASHVARCIEADCKFHWC